MQKIQSAKLMQTFLALFFISLILQPQGARCEPAAEGHDGKVAFLPFTIHAAKDLSYLKDGIRDMLASRLSANAGITVVEKATVDKALAAQGSSVSLENKVFLLDLGRQLQADYLVTGSLTSLGGGMSLDAKVIDIADPTAMPQSFYATAASEDTVIPAINQLAADISRKIFQSPPAEKAAAITLPASPSPPVREDETPSYQTAHPERAFFGPAGGSSSLVRPMGFRNIQGFTKSQNFDFGLQGLDVGDVDGDGIDDMVIASRSNVLVFHIDGSRFNHFGDVSLGKNYIIHAVSLADLNNNGKKEIYISAADTAGPSSFAVEWQQKDFEFLFQKASWYIKAINQPGSGMILAGQRAGFNRPLDPGIYQLIGNEAETIQGPLQKGQRLTLPDFINVFSFEFADIDGDGGSEIIHINQDDYLNVLRPDGKLLWRSSGLYGGTTRYIGGEEGAIGEESKRNALQPDKWKKIYIPSRIIILDINNDGLMDVVVNRNQLKWSPILKNLKSYSSGHVLGLTWNGISLTELWYTKKVDGYIADYQLKANADNPDEATLYVGLILPTGSLNVLSAKDSTVLMYDLTFENEDKEQESEK